jgi:hypothetical protein
MEKRNWIYQRGSRNHLFASLTREATTACCMTPTLLRRAAHLLSPDCPNRAIARLLGRKRSTVRSWLSEHRRMPLHFYAVLEAELVQRIALEHGVVEELKQAVWLRERQGPRPLQGFFVVRERDDPGSKSRDARWRGGRQREYKKRHDYSR